MALSMYAVEILSNCPEIGSHDLEKLRTGRSAVLIRSTEVFGLVEIEYDDALGMFEVARV